MPRLSAVLIVKNEEKDLPDCLQSLQGLVDEIIVVDDESTDQTRSIAERAGAKVFSHKLESFGEQKQFAVSQATGDWIFSIDADERVTASLRNEIKTVIQSPLADGFEVRRDFYFLGRKLRFGGQGQDWVVRLFRSGKGRFRKVAVHESIEVDGQVSRLQSPLDHFSYASLEEYLTKCNQYTALAAKDHFARGKRCHAWTSHIRPSWELFSRIALKSAWLDGQPGLMYACLSAHAVWLRQMKLWELEHKS